MPRTYKINPNRTYKTTPEDRAKARKWALDNPEIYKDRQLRTKFGITLADYRAMLESQKGGCLICDAPPQPERMLAVDHCHTTGVVRGLLCSHCNTGLGHFRDKPALILRAVAYLMNTSHA